MKNIRKALAFMLSITMILSCISIVFATDYTPTITVERVVSAASRTVDVNISLKNNPGIVNMQLSVNYDSPLKLVAVKDGGILGEEMHVPNLNRNPYYLTWANDLVVENFTSDGVIATLTFEIPEGTDEGFYDISVGYDNIDYDIVNMDFETVDFETQSGGVRVIGFIVGDVNGDGEINTADRMLLSRLTAKWDGYEKLVADMRAADTNGDGRVNTADRMNLSRYLAKWSGYENALKPYGNADIYVKSINIVPDFDESTVFYPGMTGSFIAQLNPENATNKNVIWSTDNTSCVTIDGNGNFEILSDGEATIICTASDAGKKSATYHINVCREDVSLTIISDTDDDAWPIGKTGKLTAVISPERIPDKRVSWSSDNPSCVTIDQSGNVTALNEGTATITCVSLYDTNSSATYTITVLDTNVTSITLNNTSATIEPGKTISLTATVSPSYAEDKTVIWSSSDTSVATVSSSGVVTGVSSGTATITCESAQNSEVKATCEIVVEKVDVTEIILNKTSVTLYPGDKVTLKATVSPSNATNPSVRWSSSDTSVATVSSTGVVTAKAADKTAIITCEAADGSGVSAACQITVGVYASDISITSDVSSSSWYVGKTGTLTATVSPSNATNKNVTWSSSEPECVTVDADGNVTVVKASKKNGIFTTKVTSAVITATAADGKGATGTYTINITDYKALTSIAFPEGLSEEMFVGEQVSFGVTFTPTDASEKGVKYISSNTNVATVDSKGVVKAVGEGSAVITAVSTNDSKIAVSKEIKVVPVEVIQTLAYNVKPYYAVGDVTYLSFNTSPATALTKLGSCFESQNTKVAVVTSYGGSIKLGKVMFTGVGQTKVRATTGGNEVAGDWLSVEAREIRATVGYNGRTYNTPYIENVSAGDAIVIDSYFYNGSDIDAEADEITAASNDYFDVFADRDKPGRFSVIVKEEIPEKGAYITLVSSKNANVATKVWFVNKTYALPTGDKSTLLNKFKTYSQSAAMIKSADFDKTVEYSNLVSDPEKSSTEMTIKFGLAPEVSLDKFLEDNTDSDIEADELLEDMSAESMLRDLFTDPTIEAYSVKQGEYAPEITVAAADVKKVEVIDNGITYQMKLTLNDMATPVALDAVTSSAYGKTMKVIDEQFIETYKNQLNIESTSIEESAEACYYTFSDVYAKLFGVSAADHIKNSESFENMETSLTLGSIDQNYTGGYVIFTINKITDKVVESEYHYISDMDIKDALFKMRTTMTDSGSALSDMTLSVTIKTDFTMTVDSVSKYTAMTY